MDRHQAVSLLLMLAGGAAIVLGYRWIGGAVCGAAVIYLAFAEIRKARSTPDQRSSRYGEDPRRRFDDPG